MLHPRILASCGILAMIVPAIAAATLDPRQYTDTSEHAVINWVCTGNGNDAKGRSLDIPEVCSNMCYGAYCKKFGTTLFWDQYAGTTKDKRATHAGCGRDNRCNKGDFQGKGYQCDEYPFGSTKQSDSNNPLPINRCVPGRQNGIQGAGLVALFNSYKPFKATGLGGKHQNFRSSFANAGTTKYCKGAPKPDCTNDGNEYDMNGEAKVSKKRSVSSSDSDMAGDVSNTMLTYTLTSGDEIQMHGPVSPIGTKVYTPKFHNATLMLDMLDAHVYDEEGGEEQYEYMLFNMFLHEDSIAAVAD